MTEAEVRSTEQQPPILGDALPKKEWIDRFAAHLSKRLSWSTDEATREAESNYTKDVIEDFRNPEAAADACIEEMAGDAS